MGETIQPSGVNRDWRVPCYSDTGQEETCVIDSDHGAVRVGLGDALEQYFELRGEQVSQFQRGLMTLRAHDCDRQGKWSGSCYSRWGMPRNSCLIEARSHDAVHISYLTGLTSQHQWSFELRKEQITTFETALAAAIETFHTDVAIHGQHWADHEPGETEAIPLRSMDEAVFTQKIHEMVAADAPETLAAVGEIGDHVDAVLIAYCLDFPNHFEVITPGLDSVRGSFRSTKDALRLLSADGNTKVRLVSIAEARKREI